MNKYQENRLSMYLTVQQVTNYFSDVWQDFTAFKNQFSEFEAVIDKIQKTGAVQDANITGVTQDKNDARIRITKKGLEIAGKIYAYASVIGNNKLKKRVNFNRSKFISCRDTEVIELIQIIYNAGLQHVANLADYGITQEVLDDLKAQNDAFTVSVENPRQAVTNRTKATVFLKTYFKECNEILQERIDKMMNYFSEKSPDFWYQYKSARKIVNLGHRRKVRKEEAEEAVAV